MAAVAIGSQSSEVGFERSRILCLRGLGQDAKRVLKVFVVKNSKWLLKLIIGYVQLLDLFSSLVHLVHFISGAIKVFYSDCRAKRIMMIFQLQHELTQAGFELLYYCPK